MSDPVTASTGPEVVVVLSGGVVLAICAVVIAYLKTKPPKK